MNQNIQKAVIHKLMFLSLSLFLYHTLIAGPSGNSLQVPLFTSSIDELKPYLFIDLQKYKWNNPLPVLEGLSTKHIMATLPLKDPLGEYMNRIQFCTLDGIARELCWQNILRFMNDKFLRTKYNVKDQEDAAFYTGLYYYSHWTPVSFMEKNTRNALIQKGGLGLGFDLPYQTIYSAEQLFKYYLSRYPRGKYVLGAMFNIARCRVHQKDFQEAYYTYRYAIEIALGDYEFGSEEIADRIAMELVRYNKKYGEDLDIQLKIIQTPDLKKDDGFVITLNDRTVRIKLQKRF